MEKILPKINNKSFLLEYVSSLKERTRIEKGSIKTGIDWIIYHLCIAKNWIPVRLPFFREFDKKAGKTKTGPEYGEDISYLSGDIFYVFVLKDEQLTYSNWTSKNFDTDLRRAVNVDIDREELKKIKKVIIVLAYNKDEDKNGLECYDNFVKAQNLKISDSVDLSFERWNLTRLVEEISKDLISPDLLPQHLSGLFRYVCLQMNDFEYGSKEWDNQLIPNWKRFLENVLEEPIDERKLKLIPVIFLILEKYNKEGKTSKIGWIDIIEWAMLILWQKYIKISNKEQKELIVRYWFEFYIIELEQYFIEISPLFTTEHGFSTQSMGFSSQIQAINDAYSAFWHIGRLGIMSIAPLEYIKEAEKQRIIKEHMMRSVNWLKSAIHLNPSFLRPLIDLNHIELFEIWLLFYLTNEIDSLFNWLNDLGMRLVVRRVHGDSSLPFINSRNSIEGIFESIILKEKSYKFSDSSSYLLSMLLEFCLVLPPNKRDFLINEFYNSIIIGPDENKTKTIDLMSWVPPKNWENRILKEPVHDGIGITISFDNLSVNEKSDSISQKLDENVRTIRKKYPFEFSKEIPPSVFILACIKNKSPLPPEFWRQYIFKDDEKLPDKD